MFVIWHLLFSHIILPPTARLLASPYRDHLWTLLEFGGLLTVTFTLALGKIDEGSDSDAASALFGLIITCNVTFALCVIAVALLERRRKQLRSLRAQDLWRILQVSVDRVPLLMQDFEDEDESSVKQLQNPLQISFNCLEDDEGGRSKTIDSGAGSGMQMQVITSPAAARNENCDGAGAQASVEGETADDGSDLPMLDGTPCGEHEVLPDFDAPKPKTPWKVLSSTRITKLKAANFGHVDV